MLTATVFSGQSCTTDSTDFRGGVWGVTINGDDDDDSSSSFTVGPALQIRFQQSDLSSLETHPLTPGLTLSTVGSAPSTTPAAGSTSAAISTAAPGIVGGRTTFASRSVAETLSTAAPTTSSQTSTSDMSRPENESDRSLIAAVISVTVTAIVAVIALCLFRLFQIHRLQGRPFWKLTWKPFKRPAGGPVAVGLGAWIGRRPSDIEETRATRPTPDDRAGPAELDGEIDSPIEIPASEKPLGSPENPAELEVYHNTRRSSLRESWVSRVLSRVARSSTSTRSSSRSRWTQRSLGVSGDWETFIQTKNEPTTNWPGLLSVPDTAYSRPNTMASSASDGDRTLRQLPKMRSFDRLSQGTFGNVIVRGRSSAQGPAKRHEVETTRSSLV